MFNVSAKRPDNGVVCRFVLLGRKMRVLFLNATWPKNIRHEGSQTHTRQIVDGLRQLGHEIWVRSDCCLEDVSALAGGRFRRLGQLSRCDIAYCRMAGDPLELPAWMRSPLAKRLLRLPVVWEVNQTTEVRRLSLGDKDPLSRNERDMRVAEQAQVVSLAICNTASLARYAADLSIPFTTTVPLGTDPEHFRPDVEPDRAIPRKPGGVNVFWGGNGRVWWHDFETIAGAAKRLLDDARFHFYLAGVLPKELPMAANMTLLGHRDYACMPSLCAAMDVGLAIYRDGSPLRYGICSSPLKVFDYMACGLIVMGSPIEQIRECVSDGSSGFVVPFGDPAALALRLREVASRPRLKEQFGARARKAVLQHYNWTRVVKDTEQALVNLLDGNRGV